MSYPVLQVAALVGDSPQEPPGVVDTAPGPSSSRTQDLPPVASVTNTPVRRAVYIIGEAAKRTRSAGMLGCGRVAPLTQVNPAAARPTPGHRQRPRSSPRLGHRRHVRVTPFTPTTLIRPEDSAHNGTGGSSTTGLPKWRQGREHHGTLQGNGAPATTTSSGSTHTDNPNQWSAVPTISIDAHSPCSQSSSNPKSSASLYSECNDISNLENNRYVTERIHNLVSAFNQRASRVKAHITQPPTPSTDLSEGGEDGQKANEVRHHFDSLDGDGSAIGGSEPLLVGVGGRKAWLLRHLHILSSTCTYPQAFDPQSRLYICWLLVVTISYVYNACVIPLRSVFSDYQTDLNLPWWLAVDCLADLIYILDIVVFKSRVMYLDNGFWISTPSLMRRYYFKTTRFRYDLVSLLPLDLLYFRFGPISVFRLPRLIKIQTFWEFFNRLDSVLSSPHAVRVIRTVLYMLFLIHLNTCAYYGFSKLEGIGSNRWVFQGKGNAYIRCFYFATKTATSIGKNPKPENEAEYLFMTASWLMGVFVFALLIGQIRDIVATATRNQNEYRRVMDHTQAYLHRLNLPASLQERIRLWFSYTWQSQKTLNEMKCLESLPRKMRTDIALSVHIQTLSKVQLFQDCDKALLRDLVLKLQPVLYLPGDYVCKKGEVGKEMYIVQSGQVLVMGGDQVLATLGEGSVFGEISLLALAGGNRRTANVRSRGFSSLFVLSKADLQATIKDYPEAQEILKKKAKKLIQQNEERERQEPTPDENVIIKSREATPKLLHAVLQVVRPDSFTASVIRRSSRTMSQSSLPSSCPWTSSQASPYTSASSISHDPHYSRSKRSASIHSRSSLEVPAAPGGYRESSVAKNSLSESLAEEEEEDEVMVVETCKEPGSPASSCHSHHTTITLHHSSSSPPSPILHSSPSRSTSSYEDVFISDSDQQKSPSSEGNSEIMSYSKVTLDKKANEVCSDSTSNQCLSTVSLAHPIHGSSALPSSDSAKISQCPGSEPGLDFCSKHKKSCKLSEKNCTQAAHTDEITRKNNNKAEKCFINNQQIKIVHEDVAGHKISFSHDRDVLTQTVHSGSRHGITDENSSLLADCKKNGSVRGESPNCSCAKSQQKVTRSQSSCTVNAEHRRQSSSSSTSSTYSGNSSKTPHGENVIRSNESSTVLDGSSLIKVNCNQEMGRTIIQVQNSEKSCKVDVQDKVQQSGKFSLSPPCWDRSRDGQNKFQREQHVSTISGTRLLDTPCHSTNSTEELLIKFGLNYGSSERNHCNTSTPGSCASPVSYDLFLSELSKTVPNTQDQVPLLSSSSSLSLCSGPSSWQQQSSGPSASPAPATSPPPTSAAHKISCSAIVHRECSSPDMSPFDPQESKL